MLFPRDIRVSDEREYFQGCWKSTLFRLYQELEIYSRVSDLIKAATGDQDQCWIDWKGCLGASNC
jgi:hypothetical protein